MERVPGTETLFTLPRETGATSERYGLLAHLSEHNHELIHRQWIRENIRAVDQHTFTRELRCVHRP